MSSVVLRESYAEEVRSSFFVIMASFMLVLNVIGFHESYFLSLADAGNEMSPMMHFHAASGFTLFVLFVAQSFLARSRRLDVHRKMGFAAVVISLLLAIAGVGMIRESAEGYIPNPDADQIVRTMIQASAVWVSLFVEASFVVFMSLAIVFRRNRMAHKRLMFLAFVGITSPALARMGQFPVLGLSPAVFTLSSMLLLVLTLVVYDVTSRRRVHAVTLVGGTVQIVGLALCAAVVPYTSIGEEVIVILSR